MTEKTNISPLWSILCQETSVDSTSNNISLFKIIEELKFGINMDEVDKLKDKPDFNPSKPIIVPFAFQMVVLWSKVNSQGKELFFKIAVKDPKGKQLLETSENEVRFENGKERVRAIITLNGVPLTEPGEYVYEVLVKQNETFVVVDSVPVKIAIELKRQK